MLTMLSIALFLGLLLLGLSGGWAEVYKRNFTPLGHTALFCSLLRPNNHNLASTYSIGYLPSYDEAYGQGGSICRAKDVLRNAAAT
jgi:hypothetical protein